MIELLIAAIIQISTLTASPAQTGQTVNATATATTSTTTTNPGGTGSWDDGN
jgi:guanyl-specific ribonuclease Sa